MNSPAPGTVAVTGAGMGLGLSLTKAWAARGDRVLAMIYEPAQQADVEDATRQLPGQVDCVVVDVTQPGDFAFPEDLGVLVNNAGIRLKNLPIEEIPIEEWRLYLEVNFLGAVEMVRRALPVMKSRGGGIVVNVNSGSLTKPFPFLGPYRSAKGAMAAFTETLRTEVTPLGIRVVEVMPGAMRTGLSGSSMTTRKAEAADYADYAGLAEGLTSMIMAGASDMVIVDADDAAEQIVAEIHSGRDRFRFGTDAASEAGIEAWRAGGGEPVVAGFISTVTGSAPRTRD